MSKLPVPTAKEVNEQHALARATAETAVQHAIKCGQMLARKKEELGGRFADWVTTHCEFGKSSAYAYMKVAAKSPQALEDFRSIQEALGYERQKEASPKASRSPELTATATDSRALEKPASVSDVKPGEPASVAESSESPPPAEGELEWSDADEAEYQAREEVEAQRRIEAAMESDDRLAAAFAQIKQQGALLAVANASRDRAMNQAAEAVRLLKAEQRKTARLERELDKLRGKKAA